MIYDCFLFFNELKVLELRLHELDSVVDCFVLVEGNHTFAGKPKPLYFNETRTVFRNYLHKIRHIVVDDIPADAESPWDVETYQRNAILRGLDGTHPDDIVVISDVDEIPRATIVQSFSGPLVALELEGFYYAFNCKNLAEKWIAPVIAERRSITTPQQMRMLARHHWKSGITVVKNAGWHFSFIQDPSGVQQKIQAFSHQEYNTPEYLDKDRISNRINFGFDVFDRRDHYWCAIPVDDTLPSYVREHPERFEGLLFDFT